MLANIYFQKKTNDYDEMDGWMSVRDLAYASLVCLFGCDYSFVAGLICVMNAY